ncbi:aspartate/glutamate racemase family protein [Defluviimonas sp. SAOS-178_SWC]|uniref:aspartate/glutamate racemase family protein n=1 Tax=Defluviimonas sp. SAOS-178_SWC TaxID=3121287 RepID=UPI003221F5B7
MTKIGIVGGVGWPATATYYRAICRAAADDYPGGSPPMVIESLDMRTTMASRGQSDDEASWRTFESIFAGALETLQRVGCSVLAIASVTPHIRFAGITRSAEKPVISILDATVQRATAAGVSDVLCLGTPLVLRAGLFDGAFESAGVRADRRFNPEQIDAFGAMLETYFYPGHARDGRASLLEFCRAKLAETPGSPNPTIILGCTDLIDAFPEMEGETLFEVDGLQFLDPVACHVRAVLDAFQDSHPDRTRGD